MAKQITSIYMKLVHRIGRMDGYASIEGADNFHFLDEEVGKHDFVRIAGLCACTYRGTQKVEKVIVVARIIIQKSSRMICPYSCG